MRRLTILWAIPALFVLGCNSEHPSRGVQVSTSASVTPPSSEPKIASSAETPRTTRTSETVTSHDASGSYFETTQNGKTYVFGTAAARDRFVNGDTSVKLVTRVGPNGDTYWVEADHADSLATSYSRAHPKP